jgi:hypothetical protein
MPICNVLSQNTVRGIVDKIVSVRETLTVRFRTVKLSDSGVGNMADIVSPT